MAFSGNKQDPFAIFTCGSASLSTAPVMEGGTKVRWDGEVLDFSRLSDKVRTCTSARYSTKKKSKFTDSRAEAATPLPQALPLLPSLRPPLHCHRHYHYYHQVMHSKMQVSVYNWEKCSCKSEQKGHACKCHKEIGVGFINLTGLLNRQRKAVFVKVNPLADKTKSRTKRHPYSSDNNLYTPIPAGTATP